MSTIRIHTLYESSGHSSMTARTIYKGIGTADFTKSAFNDSIFL